MKIRILKAFIFCLLITLNVTINAQDNVKGYEFLKKISGQWNGPVNSSTSAGSFDNWYIDVRPVSSSQVSQFSLLDPLTVNNFSFFIVKHGGELKVAMRTEGCFAEKCCVTYEVIDSVDEESGLYRFSDFVAGPGRANTIFRFVNDEMTMEVYTNKFNKEKAPVLHSSYKARLITRENADHTASLLGFPQPKMVKDFSNVFEGMNESIFFDLSADPYGSDKQPNTGKLKADISVDKKLNTVKDGELCIFLTTKPLFEGLKYYPERLDYLSKYVYMKDGTESIVIENVHPGKYYLYSFYDLNRDKMHKSGDFMSSDINNTIEIKSGETTEVKTVIDLIIP